MFVAFDKSPGLPEYLGKLFFSVLGFQSAKHSIVRRYFVKTFSHILNNGRKRIPKLFADLGVNLPMNSEGMKAKNMISLTYNFVNIRTWIFIVVGIQIITPWVMETGTLLYYWGEVYILKLMFALQALVVGLKIVLGNLHPTGHLEINTQYLLQIVF